MNRTHGLSASACVALLLALFVLPATGAATVDHPDRESTYPDGVANVTHDPWAPGRGDDVHVTLTLEADAAVPARVSLIFCRVEPQYVCGSPQFLERDSEGRTWDGTIRWDDRFMQEETEHLGYNLTMRFLERDGTVRKVAAPTGNHWLPEAFPEDAEGTYYFLRYGSGSAPGAIPAPPLAALLLGLLMVAGTLRGRGEADG